MNDQNTKKCNRESFITENVFGSGKNKIANMGAMF